MRLALVGASGWLGRHVGRAILHAKIVAPGHMALINRQGPVAAFAGFDGVTWATSLDDLAHAPDVVIVSVRPQDLGAVALRCPNALIVSFMAGVPLMRLAQRTGSGRIIRAMPNAACEIGASYTPWIASADTTPADHATIRALLRSFGTEDRLTTEAHLDYMTGLSGAAHAFPALLGLALQRSAEAQGIAPDVAARAAMGVVVQAAALIGTHEGALAEAVQTYLDYDGIVARALRAAREAGFERAVADGLDAAMRATGAIDKH